MSSFRSVQDATTKAYSQSTTRRSNAVVDEKSHIPSGSGSPARLLRYSSLSYHKGTTASLSLALSQASRERV